MKDISKLSVRVTTGPTGTEAAGSPAIEREILHETAFRLSISRRKQLGYYWWAFLVRAKHLFRRHTFVDHEVWSTDGPVTVVAVSEEICWFCETRRPVTPIRVEAIHR